MSLVDLLPPEKEETRKQGRASWRTISHPGPGRPSERSRWGLTLVFKDELILVGRKGWGGASSRES